MSAGCLRLGALGETVQASPLVSGGLPVIFGVHWPVDALPALSPPSYGSSAWASVATFPLYADTRCVGRRPPRSSVTSSQLTAPQQPRFQTGPR